MSGVYMSSEELFKFQIINKYLSGILNRKESAQLLNMCERSVTRIASKVKELGPFGLKNGNAGRKPKNAYPQEYRQKILELAKNNYFDFNSAHFTETIKKEFGFEVSYKTVWRWLKKSGLVKNPRRKRRRKHVYRNRLPQEGLLLQMDGCHHKFNGKEDWCLISAIDDATSHIPYAEFFSDGETTLNCMKVLSRIIELKGVPKAIYTDRAGWAGGGKRTEFSQFKRACEKLGIQLIFADTPEAKGRIERSFRTIQDRLIPELRLKGIEDLEKANEYLRSEFLENYWNKEKLVQAQDPTIAYSPLDPWLDLNQVLCVEESRVIGRDQTVSWQGKRYIIQDGNRPLCNYLAMFRTDLKGRTRVFVLEAEVEMNEIKDFRRYRKQKSDEDELREQQRTPLGLSDDLYIKMYNLILDVGNAVKKHQVTGRPLKIEYVNSRRRAG